MCIGATQLCCGPGADAVGAEAQFLKETGKGLYNNKNYKNTCEPLPRAKYSAGPQTCAGAWHCCPPYVAQVPGTVVTCTQ